MEDYEILIKAHDIVSEMAKDCFLEDSKKVFNQTAENIVDCLGRFCPTPNLVDWLNNWKSSQNLEINVSN